MERSNRIDVLIQRLCGIMSNEVRCFREDQFVPLRRFSYPRDQGVERLELKSVVDGLQVEPFLKPIILGEMMKIITNRTVPLTHPSPSSRDLDGREFMGKVREPHKHFATAVG